MQILPFLQQFLRCRISHLHLQCWLYTKRNRQFSAMPTVPSRLQFHDGSRGVHDMSRRILLSRRGQRIVLHMQGRIHIRSERVQ